MDYSEAQRRRMREAIDLLSEKGILDELGVGTIRDAISDALFPGAQHYPDQSSLLPLHTVDLQRSRATQGLICPDRSMEAAA